MNRTHAYKYRFRVMSIAKPAGKTGDRMLMYYHPPPALPAFRVPKQILQSSTTFILGLLHHSSPSASASIINLRPDGPVQRLRLAFEEGMGILNQLPARP